MRCDAVSRLINSLAYQSGKRKRLVRRIQVAIGCSVQAFLLRIRETKSATRILPVLTTAAVLTAAAWDVRPNAGEVLAVADVTNG